MLSINIILSTWAMKTLRAWLSCHHPGVAISRAFGGCVLFPCDLISDPGRILDVQSDLFSNICQCTSQRIIGPKSGPCVSSPQKRNHLQCLQTQNCRGPCSWFFFGKHPFIFTADGLDFSAATELILQNIFLRYMFPRLQDGIRVGNEEGERRSGFSHHCPCPVALGIKILIQVVWHHGKRAPNPVQSPWPLPACCVTLGSPLNSYLSLSFFFLMCKTEGLCWSLTPSGSDMSISYLKCPVLAFLGLQMFKSREIFLLWICYVTSWL